MRPEPEARDWGVPPFEPLNIRTADFDRVPVLDGPMMVNVDPAPLAASAVAPATAPTIVITPTSGSELAPASVTVSRPVPVIPAAAAVPPLVRPVPSAGSASENSGRFATVAPAPPVAELQRIVTIRVCNAGEVRWSGAQLMAALELHGLAFGRYQVFHRKHVDGRSLFCVASLIEPGTFDIAEMADQEFRGITLFAVLPGPIEPLDTLNELFATAQGLAGELSGMVQDGKGMPLSPERATALREDVARFQASLARN
jgi:cell division protein ZipA